MGEVATVPHGASAEGGWATLEPEEAVEDDVTLATLTEEGIVRVRTRSVRDWPAHGCRKKPRSGIARSWRKLYHGRRLGATG